MKTFELVGEVRDSFGRKAANKFRSEGLIPCVVYGGKDGENINFTVKNGDIHRLVYTPEVYLINLVLGDKKMMAILKEIQFHPVKDTVLHIDFLHVYDDVPVVIELPVKLKGLAKGVKAGGKLSLDTRYLKVRAMVDKLPENLVIDVSHLLLGRSIQVGELNFDNLELLNAKNAVVARVQLTRAARGAAAAAAAAGDVSTSDDEEEEGENSEE